MTGDPGSTPAVGHPFAADLLRDRRAVITGGGTGIGLATARMMMASGARVALLGRREDVLRAAAASLGPDPSRVLAVACDIREPERVATAVDAVMAGFGGIDILVNNAGGQFPAPAESLSPNGFAAVVRNNLLGTFNMTREVATRALIPARAGAVVNVTAQVERGFPGMAHTGAARAGVENLTKTLAIEWMRHHIRVNGVAPGIIDSEALTQYPPSLLAGAKRSVPMRRFGTVQEVAAAIVFLSSDAASYITGVVLPVDGASRLWGETWIVDDPEA